jgi:hypothetical protein
VTNVEFLVDVHPDLAACYQEENPIPKDAITTSESQWSIWRCPRGHTYEAPVHDVVWSHRRRHRLGCPQCQKSPQSPIEFDIGRALSDHTTVDTNSGLADIILPEHKVAIEFDGYRYHHRRRQADIRTFESLKDSGLTPIRIRHYRLSPIATTDIYYRGRPSATSFATAVVDALPTLPNPSILPPAIPQNSLTLPSPHPRLDDVVGEDSQVRYVLSKHYDIDSLTPSLVSALPDTFTTLSYLLHIADNPNLPGPRHWLTGPDPLIGVSPREYLTSMRPRPETLLRDVGFDPGDAGLDLRTFSLLTLLSQPPTSLLP